MSVFEKIGKLFSPKKPNIPEDELPSCFEPTDTPDTPAMPEEEDGSQKEKETEPVKKAVPKEVTPMEDREQILHLLVKSMNQFLDIEMKDKSLVIWLDTDHLTFQTYDTETYKKRIQNSLLNEYGLIVESVLFHIGKPSDELRCLPLGRSGTVFLQITSCKSNASTAIARKAVITIFGDKGSLLHSPCLLSADEMKEKNIPAYNIGASEFPQVQTGYRQNHIAIDDNPNGPMIEKNKYVSRTHAHIGYSDDFGFYLQVEAGGTRLMGKRTRIFRGEETRELDNTRVKEPLQSGDLIELGKSVTLQFVTIKD